MVSNGVSWTWMIVAVGGLAMCVANGCTRSEPFSEQFREAVGLPSGPPAEAMANGDMPEAPEPDLIPVEAPESAAPPTADEAGPAILSGAEPIWAGPYGQPEGAASPNEHLVLQELNATRAWAGLEPVERDGKLAYAAQAHADFVVDHWALYSPSTSPSPNSLHNQLEGLSGFTGESFADRIAASGAVEPPLSEVIARHPRGDVSLHQWLDSLYHRIPLLRADAASVGWGARTENGTSVSVMLMTRHDMWGANANAEGSVLENDPGTSSAGRIHWPPHGAEEVPSFWDGAETPQPPVPPGGYPSGPIVTLSFATGGELVLVDAVLEVDGADPVEAVVLQPGTDPNIHWPTLALYAHEPLEPYRWHRVEWRGFFNDEYFDHVSWFRTGGDVSCDPLGTTCPPGRGCYLNGPDPVCAWHGSLPAGAGCQFSNDCAPGSSCLGDVCRAFCGANEEATDPTSCAFRCPGAYATVDGTNGLGVCVPPTCRPDFDSCSATEQCSLDGPPECIALGSGSEGAICTGTKDCQRAHGCTQLSASSVGTCRVLCDAHELSAEVDYGANHPADLPSCWEACPEQVVGHPKMAGIGICL